MTVTALAVADPDDPRHPFWTGMRASLGEVHAAWCPSVPDCAGECRHIEQVGDVTAVYDLPRDSPRPTVALTTSAGVVVMDGDTAEEVARQILVAVDREAIPHPGLRRR